MPLSFVFAWNGRYALLCLCFLGGPTLLETVQRFLLSND